ncbi:MAG: hypothetical protein ACJ8AJ_10265 [Gemmatimonadaceae bacterium]
MDIEDRAATALAAYQPVALTRITQAERAATDLAARHGNAAPRTEWRFAGDELGADLLQLALTVLRGVVGH